LKLETKTSTSFTSPHLLFSPFLWIYILIMFLDRWFFLSNDFLLPFELHWTVMKPVSMDINTTQQLPVNPLPFARRCFLDFFFSIVWLLRECLKKEEKIELSFAFFSSNNKKVTNYSFLYVILCFLLIDFCCFSMLG